MSNVVDSSGWLAYFADEPSADFFAPAIEEVSSLIVPAISLYEVFKHILLRRSEDEAMQAIGVMLQGQVIDLDRELALNAAKISVEGKLPMADSIILATAYKFEATVWTQDSDFEGLRNVRYLAKN
ncbi:type II toxin-antitoxin system VapC family toxin [Nodosilinea sp. P-1105]|uniref:type II toxin-antitoxin system VapC family toxin n=1 Tax=Nodosilinea sp. P-1105 TaxID=2546229 RepID=UPI00146C0D46|nr:type II toxin-antitoxin system VapC family toxin [Nodosilinea sp. P-1105]NMF82407.1 type II toxin-antitoxin system VapC family toxin [Nodosilinea sp. P-1105]